MALAAPTGFRFGRSRLAPKYAYASAASLLLTGKSVSVSVTGGEALGTYVLDDFESGLRIVEPDDPTYRYLWRQTESGTVAISVSTADKHGGASSMLNAGTTGYWQCALNPVPWDLPGGWPNGWVYMRRFVNNPTMAWPGGTPAWPLNTINRLRFWMRIPSGIARMQDGDYNCTVGVHITDTEGIQETDNNHWYHPFDAGYCGAWEQFIVDTHPDYQRQGGGSLDPDDEGSDLADIYGGPNTYFDLMSRFYVDLWRDSLTQNLYLDDFEFYSDTQNITTQVRSVHCAYVLGSNLLRLGWRRKKDEFTVNHLVRYAWSDIHTLGWANATVAPNGTVAPLSSDTGAGAKNGMQWETNEIDMTGHSTIYIAIKPENSSNMYQIVHPLD